MSSTSHSCKIISFEEKRREFVIRELIRRQIHEPEEIAQILQIHEFLLQFEYMKMSDESMDKDSLLELESQLQPLKEKFDELFEIIK